MCGCFCSFTEWGNPPQLRARDPLAKADTFAVFADKLKECRQKFGGQFEQSFSSYDRRLWRLRWWVVVVGSGGGWLISLCGHFVD